jgi:hypothetical protein
MNRRDILKSMAIMVGAPLVLPYCSIPTEKEVLSAYNNLNLTKEEKALIQKLCEVLIPSDEEVKGAADLEIENFVLVMANDCLDEQEKSKFINGLRTVKPYSSKVFGNGLNKMSFEQLEEVILSIININKESEAVKYFEWNALISLNSFINTTKQFSIQGFVLSQYYMTKIMPYTMVPGKFQGEVIIQEGEKINIYE